MYVHQLSYVNLKSTFLSIFFLICDCKVAEMLLHYWLKILRTYVCMYHTYTCINNWQVYHQHSKDSV